MGFVMGKCPNCGANLKINEDRDVAVCQYCNTPFIVEKAINIYTAEQMNLKANYVYVINVVQNSNIMITEAINNADILCLGI
ncbi:hypothetical protein [Butyrivibrio sp. JL13D10]|uniref:hypothetical protein n=1 Tax=Butyrivibrio sp. JL13D10 TaxID=3236815 RepID=UPI0038B49C1F